MAKPKHASAKPSEAEKGGGQFGFPPGSVVTITEAAWTEAQEAGEKFVSQGDPEDPVLKLVGEIEGDEAERPPVYLRAGKVKRGLRPSKDGEFLDIDEGSTATAISEGCNADVFLKSISDESVHKKMAVPEELHDDGISAVLVGLKFVAGAIIVKREGLDSKNARPTLVAEEIVELPKAARKGKGRAKDEEEEEDEKPARRSSRKEPEEEEEEEAPRARRGKKPSADDESEKKVEQTIVDALESGKYKKGLPLEKVWTIVYNAVRSDDDKKQCMAFVEDDDWVKGDRPWKVSGKGDDAVLLPV